MVTWIDRKTKMGMPTAAQRARTFPGRMVVLLLGLMLGLCHARADTEVSKEYRIKAAFLYNFTKFVEWPPERFADDEAPIVIGVLGDDPFGRALEETVQDRKVNARPVRVVKLNDEAGAAAAHVVFVAEHSENRFETFIRDHAGSVLTVGESPRAAELGSVIVFRTIGDKVRFEVNVGAAERRGLKISAQLQKLATAVRR